MDQVDAKGLGNRGKQRSQDYHSCASLTNHADYQKHNIDEKQEYILTVRNSQECFCQSLRDLLFCQNPSKDGGCGHDQKNRSHGQNRLIEDFL